MKLLLSISALFLYLSSAFAAQPPKPDAAILQEIKARMAKSKIASNNFKFTAQNGTVTIEGKTDVMQHKGSATRMAKSSGARQVINNVVISAQAREKAASQLEKGRKQKAAAPASAKPAATKTEAKPTEVPVLKRAQLIR